MKTLFTLVTFLVALLLQISVAFAKTYPWVNVHSRDLRFSTDPQAEISLRLWLIDNAKYKIDVGTYDQRKDKLGQPIIERLRNAANRGVKVRFLRGGLLAKHDAELAGILFTDAVEKALLTPPTQQPIQYALMGGKGMVFKGWSYLAGAHEKLLLVDDKYLLTTGRAHWDKALNWLDTFFILTGPWVNQAQTAFEELWTTIQIEHGNPPESNVQTAASSHKQSPTFDIENFDAIDTWSPISFSASDLLPESSEPLHEPLEEAILKARLLSLSNAQKDTLKNEEPVMKARLLHNDLLKQLNEHCENVPWIYNYTHCSSHLKDPVTLELAELLKKAETVKIYTLATTLAKPVKSVILERLEESKQPNGRKFDIQIFTNTKTSHTTFAFYPIAWYVGLEDLNDILQAGAKVYGIVKTPQGPEFLHRKVALFHIPGEESVVIFGSHNFNRASTVANDEMSFEILSTALANQFEQIFETDTQNYGFPMDPAIIQNDNWWHTLPGYGWNSPGWRFLLGIFEAGV